MKTIEIYKTDVEDPLKADAILNEIRRALPGSDPSFDLDDCDRVLRVEHLTEIDETKVRSVLKRHGYKMDQLL